MGTVSLPAGPGAEPRKQTHFLQQSIENWLKIRSLTSHFGKHESTYFNNEIFYRYNKKILHHRFIIEISRMKPKKKKKKNYIPIIIFFNWQIDVEAPAYVRTACYAPVLPNLYNIIQSLHAGTLKLTPPRARHGTLRKLL